MLGRSKTDPPAGEIIDRLKVIDARLEALQAPAAPPDSPYRDNLKCWLRQPDKPCKCRLWMEVLQEGDTATGTPSKLAKGCYFDLFPWLISGAIISSNRAQADVGALRQDVQEGLGGIQQNIVHGFKVIGNHLERHLLNGINQSSLLLNEGRDYQE